MKLMFYIIALLISSNFSYSNESPAKNTPNIITGKDASKQINGFYEDDNMVIKIEENNKFMAIYSYKERITIIGSAVGTFDPKTGVAKGLYCERNKKYTGKVEFVFIKKGKKLSFLGYYTDGKKNTWKKDWKGKKSTKPTPPNIDLFESKKGLCFVTE